MDSSQKYKKDNHGTIDTIENVAFVFQISGLMFSSLFDKIFAFSLFCFLDLSNSITKSYWPTAFFIFYIGVVVILLYPIHLSKSGFGVQYPVLKAAKIKEDLHN